jgi:hypothetical protein
MLFNCKITKTIKVKSIVDIPKNYTGIVVWPDGEKHWYLNGKLHREDGPAAVRPDGEKQWYLNGRLHREEGPCTECKDCHSGNFEPASEDSEVSPKEKSLAKPKTCSKPGPAIVYPNGEKYWYLNGNLHREEGPCTECKDCHSGNFELCSKPGPAAVWANGRKEWYLNGEFHKEDGPAIVCPDGRKYWFLNGKEADKKTVELYYMLKHKKLIKL